MPSDNSLNALSATEIAACIAAKKISCEDVARACLARIAAREPMRKAWVFLDPDLVIRNAQALDAASNRGPLHGVPVGVKDIIDTFDMPTQMGSPIYCGYRSFGDAACIALLRRVGALIAGKTVTCEFAGAQPAETTNPHDALRTPGGSSSGSAAAVADLMVPVAFGTQTGGSVQRPASYCGVVGYKPSYGLINTEGVKPAAISLDTVGLFARTVEDIELATRVLTSSAPAVWLRPEERLRIGVCRTYVWGDAEQSTRDAVEDAAERLAALSFSVRDVDIDFMEELQVTREIINDYERARTMSHEWQFHRDALSAMLSRTIRNGLLVSNERYIEAVRRVEQFRQQVRPVFEDIDVLLTPAVLGEAPLGFASTGDHRMQSIWTQIRLPTIGLPTHSGPNGMPVGIQLVGAPQGDFALTQAAQLVFAHLGRGPVVTN